MSVLVFVGLFVFVLGGIALLVAAFRVSIVWGLLCFFFPPVQVLFIIVHWGKAWRSLLVVLLGIVMVVLGTVRTVYLNAPEFQQFLTNYRQLVQSVTAAGSASEQPVQEYSPDDPTIVGNVVPAEVPLMDEKQPASGGESVPCEGQGCGD